MYRVTSSQYIISALSPTQLPRTSYPEIAFAGRSNVGKSSLINTLLGQRRLAQTSSTPGKTRALNFFCVNERLYFVDLPGYGFAAVPKELRNRWQKLVEPYLRDRRTLRGVIQLIDCRHEPMESDLQLRQWLAVHRIPTLMVLTKADKLSRSKAQQALETAQRTLSRGEDQPVLFSATTREGRVLIWKWIENRLAPQKGTGADLEIELGKKPGPPTARGSFLTGNSFNKRRKL